MTHAHQLTDKQLMLLSAASQRHDNLLALPDNLKGGAARALVSRLLSRSLVEEVAVGSADPYWRMGEDGAPKGLRITPAGRQAIGAEAEDAPVADPSDAPQPAEETAEPAPHRQSAVPLAPRPQREGTKRALVIALLSREQGASLDDLVTATGWLPHTTRAALTGLRQRGSQITRTRAEDNRMVYRLAAASEPAGAEAAPEPVEV